MWDTLRTVLDTLQGRDEQSPLWQLLRLIGVTVAVLFIGFGWFGPSLISSDSDIAVILGFVLVGAILALLVELYNRARPLLRDLDTGTTVETRQYDTFDVDEPDGLVERESE